MITAIDSSVLIDVLTGHQVHGQASAAALRRARQRGTVLACSVVWAEVMAWYDSDSRMRSDMEDAGIVYSPIGEAAATEAGIAWGRYRDAGGPRSRVIADFLIGAHARCEADVLLTRDRGFHGRYFASLVIDDPSRTEA
jgi:predicted nucleic acid-binding protein